MTVDQLVKSLMQYNPDAEITLYDDENDRGYDVLCVDEDKGDESDIPQVLIMFQEGEIMTVIDDIDEALNNKYKVLDGGNDFLIVKDRETGREFEIKTIEVTE